MLLSVRIKRNFTTIPVVINSRNIVSQCEYAVLAIDLRRYIEQPFYTTAVDRPLETAMEVDSTSRIVTGGNMVYRL
jgi:hypothetical protein